MKVKDLIKELLELPMDSEVDISVMVGGEFISGKADMVINYVDGDVGIVSYDD